MLLVHAKHGKPEEGPPNVPATLVLTSEALGFREPCPLPLAPTASRAAWLQLCERAGGDKLPEEPHEGHGSSQMEQIGTPSKCAGLPAGAGQPVWENGTGLRLVCR